MSNIYLRQTTLDDLPRIIEIIDGAKKALRDRGVNQWQDGYPSEEVLKRDIQEDINYVLILDGEIVGVATLQQGYDKNYQDMDSGAWDDDSDVTYSIIHRIAVDSAHQGEHLGSYLIQHLLTMSHYLGYSDVRTDTHPDNLIMQHIITNGGFEEKGTVTMDEDHGVRKAYQILLK
ncbi:GNAT family N-acetyltransferase [Companilactobacillus nuruki]|uniref:GNAT family N-acetyltransferase n=1 Tax=Companilactobacillus nuruki TaxID=1993540 RepID=A0A2N7ARB1_9LACO|nr:GNAT family N-acetyltransferase [Companilactobacillus nuruki]PMD67898.1 GNAT family N-acetyltransferase [Companilactobacillus nuruki]